MPDPRQRLGQTGESLALKYLLKRGYKLLESNYRNRIGEIDIIARDGDTLVFVEVKTRRSERYGSPRLAVTPHKQKKISRTALAYLKYTGQMDCKARFDVVFVKTGGTRPEIELIQNAFPLCYDG
ncbi:MAG: YraN family protein [Desulfosalsimonadaceae bacterium]